MVERREGSIESIFPNFEEIRRVKKGSRLSRFFRHIFEYRAIRKILGTNIAMAIMVTTLFPTPTGSIDIKAEGVVVTEAPIVLPTEKVVRFPVDDVRITQGYRVFHPGLDLDGLTGDTIYPFMRGVVEAIDYSKYAYGNAIYINHGGGTTSLYAHLSKIVVKVNDEVTTNTKIGEMGASGRAFGDHLHFEVRKEGLPINPLSVLPL